MVLLESVVGSVVGFWCGVIQLQTEFCKSSKAVVTDTSDTYGCLLILLANCDSTDQMVR